MIGGGVLKHAYGGFEFWGGSWSRGANVIFLPLPDDISSKNGGYWGSLRRADGVREGAQRGEVGTVSLCMRRRSIDRRLWHPKKCDGSKYPD